MASKIKIVCIGKIRENYIQEGINEFLKRLRPFCKINIIELKDEGIKKCHIFVFKNNYSAKSFWGKVGWVKRNDIQIFSKTL